MTTILSLLLSLYLWAVFSYPSWNPYFDTEDWKVHEKLMVQCNDRAYSTVYPVMAAILASRLSRANCETPWIIGPSFALNHSIDNSCPPKSQTLLKGIWEYPCYAFDPDYVLAWELQFGDTDLTNSTFYGKSLREIFLFVANTGPFHDCDPSIVKAPKHAECRNWLRMNEKQWNIKGSLNVVRKIYGEDYPDRRPNYPC